MVKQHIIKNLKGNPEAYLSVYKWHNGLISIKTIKNNDDWSYLVIRKNDLIKLLGQKTKKNTKKSILK